MKLKRLGYGLSAVALTASILPMGNVFAENEACTADYVGDTCVAENATSLQYGLKNGNVKTINVLNDIATTGTFVINHGVTLNGAGHKVDTTATMGFSLTTDEPVVINNVVSNTTGEKSKGIQIYAEGMKSYDLTINDSTLRANQYGIIDYAQYYGARGSKLTITNSKLQWVGTDGKTVANAEQDLASLYAYGIYSYGMTDATVKITDSEITGYRYANSLWYDAAGGSYTIDGSYISGRTAFDSFAKATEEKPFNVEIKNSTLHGINNFSGGSENYANIILDYNGTGPYYAKNNHIKLTDVTFTVYENEDGMSGKTANQYATTSRVGDVEDSKCSIEIYGNTSYLVSDEYKAAKAKTTYPQTTPFLEDSMYQYMTAEDTGIKVYGGTYSYDPTLFKGEDTTVIKDGDKFIVIPAVKTETTDSAEEVFSEDKETADKNEASLDAEVKAVLAEVLKEYAALEDGKEITLESGTKLTVLDADKLKEALIAGATIETELYRIYGDQTDSLILNGQGEVVDALKAELEDGAEVAGIFDYAIRLTYVYGGGADILGEITELATPVKLTFDTTDENYNIPAVAENAKREWTVVRYHGDKAEAIESEIDENGLLSFESDKFSSYLVAYTDTVETPDTGVFTATNTTAEAGSNVAGAIATAVVVAVVTMAGVALKLNKR